jgi:hypothetical protein
MDMIFELLSTLAKHRPLFHSEADFQHALAWELHNHLPDARIRLELPVLFNNKLLHVDIWIVHENRIIAIELKYKTRKLATHVGDEQFMLLNQSAQDIGRYDFIKDIQRLENLTAGRTGAVGYAILLTNDSSYWSVPRDNRSVDAAFRLHENRTLQGLLAWEANASAGTMRGREEPFQLKGSYPLHWDNYSHPVAGSYGVFRHLTAKVENNSN